MTRRKTTDKLLADRLENLRWQMANMNLTKPEEMTDAERKEFLDCLSEVVRLEREVSAREGIREALKDEEEVPQ